MGTVYLVPSHRQLFCHNINADTSLRVELTEEILSTRITGASPNTELLFKNALRGLQKLDDRFDATVSLQWNLDPEYMGFSHRTWGEITFAGRPQDIVVQFSHDTRFDNYPFTRIGQWTEQLSPELSDEGYRRFCREWTPDRWHKFFLERLAASASKYENKAQKQEAEVYEMRRFAEKIRSCLI